MGFPNAPAIHRNGSTPLAALALAIGAAAFRNMKLGTGGLFTATQGSSSARMSHLAAQGQKTRAAFLSGAPDPSIQKSLNSRM